MPILDSQVHAYERNHPGRPWVGTLQGPAEVTGDQMVAAMDAVGVDGAILVSPFSMYRYDASYALEVYAAHPGRFGLVKPVDPTDPGGGRDDRRLGGHRGHGRHPRSCCETTLRPTPPTPASTASWPPPRGTRCRSTWRASGRLEQAGQLAARNPEHAAGDRPSRAAAAARAAARRRSRSPICRSCWRWPRTPTSRSRSAAPARCRTSRSPTRTSGTRSAASSTPSASIAACGAPTGPARSRC